jgi:hypothetical protein
VAAQYLENRMLPREHLSPPSPAPWSPVLDEVRVHPTDIVIDLTRADERAIVVLARRVAAD